MSSGGDAEASAPAPDASPNLDNVASLVDVDATSVPESYTHQLEAEGHGRSESGSSGAYTSDSAQPPAPLPSDPRDLKRSDVVSQSPGGTSDSDGSLEPAVEALQYPMEPVHTGEDLDGSELQTRVTIPMSQPISVNIQLPEREQVLGMQISPSGGSNTPDSTVSRPLSTRLPSFGAHGSTEEDRLKWERIQTIGGNPTLARVKQAAPDAMAEEGTRSSQNIQEISSNGLDGPGSNSQLRLSVDDRSSSSSNGVAQRESQIPRSQRRQRPQSPPAQSKVIVPRWQPDAEVTFCPICSTQFSFFIRKHHCRKCGRVVCNACSPHRITIPYQFIVQPPAGNDTLNPPNSRPRPTLDPARAGSSSEFESLGGGERVRLCNPCVPDPNTAPPQTPSPSSRIQQRSSPISTHNRSLSSVAAYTSSLTGLSSSTPSERPGPQYGLRSDRSRRPRQPSILGRQPRNSPPQSRQQPHSPLFFQSNTNTNGSQDQASSDSRYRASTISHGTVRDHQNTEGDQHSVLGLPNRPTVPSYRAQSNSRTLATPAERHSRPLPRRPQRIAEEDECPVCHEELPSSQLPDSEALRAEHITRCIEDHMQGTLTTRPAPPQTAATSPLVPSATRPSDASSSSVTVPTTPTSIANTPEARMAAREQAHAAVVLGQNSPPPSAYRRLTGLFPYKATEKDCVDDAECTICLEEFEVGQDMGRLECFCRFHLHCIRSWFEGHYGQCPVHHQAS